MKSEPLMMQSQPVHAMLKLSDDHFESHVYHDDSTPESVLTRAEYSPASRQRDSCRCFFVKMIVAPPQAKQLPREATVGPVHSRGARGLQLGQSKSLPQPRSLSNARSA